MVLVSVIVSNLVFDIKRNLGICLIPRFFCLLRYSEDVSLDYVEGVDEVGAAEASDVFGGDFLLVCLEVGFREWSITPMPSFFGIACARGVGGVGLEEAEFVGVGA